MKTAISAAANAVAKYRPFVGPKLDDRKWPSRTIKKAPIWCSVDLRDGNQALATPMDVAKKLEMFDVLVKCGFKEIEVGFPAASDTEFEFVRHLIEKNLIPDDVTIQVLVQAREDLIERTIDSLIGAKKVIIHLYNSTSPAQRRIVFGLEKPEIVRMAMRGTEWVKKHAVRLEETSVVFQYSPESFSATETEFALEICEAVMDIWGPTPERKMILNLPDTVEVAMPNVYADQIEWFCRNLEKRGGKKCRDSVVISVHTHNDRGTGIAATELGILAGADRVEGTLFGNGERTGNLDIVTVALNLFTQGIDSGLDFSNLDEIRGVYEKCTDMKVPPRQPYSGDLVFTAFSGSHQDAIRKGLLAMEATLKKGVQENECVTWDVPYLIIDPKDVGRTYDGENGVIRVNGQSGKAGIAHLLQTHFGIIMPKEMQREFGPIAGVLIDKIGREVLPVEIKSMFELEYISSNSMFFALKDVAMKSDGGVTHCCAHIFSDAKTLELIGEGNGPIAAFVKALGNSGVKEVQVIDYHEHALASGAEAKAISYIHLQFPGGARRWGVGIDESIEMAPIKAVISALNRE